MKTIYICRTTLKMSKQYRLFIGNPGVGKSTLVNCLAQEILFNNGVSIGGGMTYQMEKREHDGIIYMDTPGLADIKLRKAAAEAITKALRQNGIYQIFFVVTLEAGRVRPQDLATIKLVLENAKDITYYSLIVNKLTKTLYKKFQENDKQKLKELVSELNFGRESNVEPPAILLLLREDDLDDVDNAFTEIQSLKKFVDDAPCMIVVPDHVRDIPGDDSFDKIVAIFEEQLSQLRQDNEQMRARLEDTERKYREMKENEVVIFFYLSVYISYYFLSVKCSNWFDAGLRTGNLFGNFRSKAYSVKIFLNGFYPIQNY